jgi:hypothetical protein
LVLAVFSAAENAVVHRFIFSSLPISLVAAMSNQYIYQYWVVRDDDRSDVMAGPFNSEYEAWLERDDNSDWVVVKTKHRVLDTSED